MTAKTQNVGEESKKCRFLRMYLNLNYQFYQFKGSRYNYGSTYMNPQIKHIKEIHKNQKEIQAYYKRKSSSYNRKNKKKKK